MARWKYFRLEPLQRVTEFFGFRDVDICSGTARATAGAGFYSQQDGLITTADPNAVGGKTSTLPEVQIRRQIKHTYPVRAVCWLKHQQMRYHLSPQEERFERIRSLDLRQDRDWQEEWCLFVSFGGNSRTHESIWPFFKMQD